MRRASPQPIELIARALLAAALVLGTLHLLQWQLLQRLLPAFDTGVRLLGEKFSVLQVALVGQPAPAVRFVANLAVPVQYAGHMVYPFGWNGGPGGAYQVLLSLPGLLQYTALLLIIVLAWPATRWREYPLRLLLALPLVALLLLAEAPMTVVAELWSAVRNQADPAAFCGWMVWSRFLMGGGGLLIAGVLGTGTCVLARRLAHLTRA